MKILYCHDNVYLRKRSDVYSAGQFSYSYWHPYLEAFGSLCVLGRGRDVSEKEDVSKLNKSNGNNVEIITYPNMNSLKGLLKNREKIKQDIAAHVHNCDGVIIRAMSEIGWLAFCEAQKHGRPVAHEMSGCPWDNTWNHGSLAAKIYAPMRYLRARKVAASASHVLYVTRDFLPRRYPAKGEVAIASNVRLNKTPQTILKKRLEKIEGYNRNQVFRLGIIGALDHRLKGVHVALDALAKCRNKNFELHLLGPGGIKAIEKQAEERGLVSRLIFHGVLPAGQPVYDWLDDIDLYMQPSFHEGLPRALIEAMSRGCPALGSMAGGIPELLPKDVLHKPGDAVKLAHDLDSFFNNQNSVKAHAQRNFEAAQHYTADKLVPIRKAFWSSFAQLVQNTRA